MCQLSALELGLAVSLAVFGLGFALSLRLRRVNVVDTMWGLAFLAMALVAFVVSAGHEAALSRRVLLLALVSCWGVRLALYLGLRSRGHREDPRYAAMLQGAQGSPHLFALTRIFLLQGVVAWFVALPVLVGMFEKSPPNGLAFLGTALWAVGFGFEAIGDAQLARFKSDPRNHGQVMDRGLWRYTRHPNYFGEACMWAGLYLIAAQETAGALTVLSPLVMIYFVSARTGKPLLERQLAPTKPGYAEYVQRTSGFLPRPPRRSAGS